jgi:hypothetical protein
MRQTEQQQQQQQQQQTVQIPLLCFLVNLIGKRETHTSKTKENTLKENPLESTAILRSDRGCILSE